MARILIVEDEAVIAEQLQRIVIGSGYEVAGIASSAREAVDKARDLRPDLVLMDVLLGGEQNGIEAAATIKEEMSIPAIFVSAYSEELLVERAKKVEPYGYILKPFHDREVTAAIEVALHKLEMEARLKESEERYRAVVDQSRDAIFLVDLDTKQILASNPAHRRMLGYTMEEMQGMNLYDFVAHERDDIDEKTRSIVESREHYLGERKYRRKDGALLDVEVSANLISYGGGEAICALARDITERKRAEEALRESEEKFSKAFRASPDYITISEMSSGRIIEVNETFLKAMDFSREEIIGKTSSELGIWKDVGDRKRLVDALKRDGFVRDAEVEFLSKAGEPIVGLLSTETIEIAGERVMLTIVKDITRRKKVEGALRESEERFRSAFDNAATGMSIVANDGRFMEVNRTLCEMLGYSEEELLDKTWMEITSPDHLEGCYEWLRQVREGERSTREKKFIHKMGYPVWVSVSSSKVRGPDGKILYYVSLFQDITDRRRAEEALRERVKELGCLFGVSDIAQTRGLSLDEVFKQVADLIPPGWQYPETTCARITFEGREFNTGNFRETEWKMVEDINLHDERVGSVEVCYLEERPEIDEGPFLEEERNLLKAIAERLGRVVERKRAEDALKKSEALLKETQRISKLGGWEYDVETGRIAWTDEVYRIYGVTKDYDPSDVERDLEFYAPEHRATIEQAFSDAVNRGEPYDLELRFINLQGERLWVRTIGNPVFENGQVVKVVGNIMDITERKRAEDALSQERERMSTILSALDTGLSLINSDKTVEWVNEKLKEMFPGDPTGRVCHAFYESREEPCPGCSTLPVFETGEAAQVERFNSTKGKWYQIVSQPIKDDTGKVIQVLEAVTDITARKRVDEALKDSEEKYRTLVENTLDWVWTCDLQGRQRFANRAVKEVLGYEVDEIVGKDAFDLMHPEDRPRVKKWFERAVKEKSGWREAVIRWLHRDGSTRYLESTARPTYDMDGNVTGYTGIDRDITERRRAEEALRESEEQLRLITDNLPVLISYVDFRQRYLFNNKAYEDWFGIPADKFYGRHVKELLGQDAYGDIKEYIEEALAGREVRYETEIPYSDAGKRSVDALYLPHLGRDGEVRGFFALVQDISARKKAEEALRASEAFLERVMELSPFAMWIADNEGTVIKTNNALRKALNLTDEQIVGKYNVLKDENLEEQGVMPRVRAVFEKLEPARFTVEWSGAKAGDVDFAGAREIVIDVSMFPVESKDGRLANVVCQWVDITERKRAEEALKKEALRRSILMDRSRDGIAIINQDHEVVEANPRFAEMLGYTHEEVIGLHTWDWEALMTEAEIRAAFADLTKTRMLFETRHRRKDGTIFDVEVSAGGAMVGDTPMVFTVCRDITERKEAEHALRARSEELQALARRLTEVEETERRRMARELHDTVGQNLTAMGINLKMIRDNISVEEYPDVAPRIEDSIVLIEETGDRIRHIMAELRPSVLDDYGFAAALRWLGDNFSERTGVPLEMDVAEKLRLKAEEETVLFRIAQEALTNIAKHADPSRVNISFQEFNGLIKLKIADDGRGFDLAALKEPVKTKGLGLVTMRERASALGGELRVYSEPGGGTEVVVDLKR